MRKICIVLLILCVSRLYPEFSDNMFLGYEFIPYQYYGRTVDLSKYFQDKCAICKEQFNYSVVVDSNCNVTQQVEPETYFGKKMHKECYERFVDFLIYDYDKRKKEYEDTYFLLQSTICWRDNLIMSTNTIIKK